MHELIFILTVMSCIRLIYEKLVISRDKLTYLCCFLSSLSLAFSSFSLDFLDDINCSISIFLNLFLVANRNGYLDGSRLLIFGCRAGTGWGMEVRGTPPLVGSYVAEHNIRYAVCAIEVPFDHCRSITRTVWNSDDRGCIVIAMSSHCTVARALVSELCLRPRMHN